MVSLGNKLPWRPAPLIASLNTTGDVNGQFLTDIIDNSRNIFRARSGGVHPRSWAEKKQLRWEGQRLEMLPLFKER